MYAQYMSTLRTKSPKRKYFASERMTQFVASANKTLSVSKTVPKNTNKYTTTHHNPKSEAKNIGSINFSFPFFLCNKSNSTILPTKRLNLYMNSFF